MKKNRLLFIILLCAAGFLFSSCYTPSPLYGTWKDNSGNSLQFFDDGSFTGIIKGDEDKSISYSGSYSVIDNVIIFVISEPSTDSKNVEWDVRGAILYLDWTNTDGTLKTLSLSHTARQEFL